MKVLGNKVRKGVPEARTSFAQPAFLFDVLPCRLTKELDRTARLAVMLAKSRALRSISAADFLAAMYLNHWERLERYWDEPTEIETYIVSLCRVSPQRWHKWLLEYEASRLDGETHRSRKISLGRRQERETQNDGFGLSRELQSVFRRAARITPGRERHGEKTIPILTSESVLLAMARDTVSELGQRLALSGLNIDKLERSAKDPRKAPIH